MLRRLSNFSERRVHDEIVDAAEQYGSIYRKIRVADVINIDELSSGMLRAYALQAHFDFCACDAGHFPAFAVEYDGSGHDPKNDWKKNQIAREADLALFRIDERLVDRTRGGITFLQYLVHTYFLGEAFLEMQERGTLDPTEPFMMCGFLKPDAKHIFDSDFDFLSPARRRVNSLLSRAHIAGGPFHHLRIATSMFATGDSNFVGFASVPIGSKFIYGRAQLEIGTPSLGKLGALPFGWSALGDYCEGMALEDLADQIETYFANGGHVVRNQSDVREEIEELCRLGLKPLRGGGGADQWLMSLTFKDLTQSTR